MIPPSHGMTCRGDIIAGVLSMRRHLAPLLLLSFAFLAVPARAQSGPSAEQMIPMLKPARTPAISLNVEFATGSAEIGPAARRTLDALGRALSSKDLAQYRFRVEGHTDTAGSADVNRALSQRRADAVAVYLVQHDGIAPERLQSVGMGEERLAVPTPPQTPNAHNRRVNVVNLGA